MWKKSDDFSNPDLVRLLASPQAQQLARMLGQMDPATLSRAAELATRGDTEGAKKMLSPILNDPKVKDLQESMEDTHG